MTADEAIALIERIGSDDVRWEGDFCGACFLLSLDAHALTHAQVARLLRFLDDHDCYYHSELCEMKDSVLKEAAARLERLARLMPR